MIGKRAKEFVLQRDWSGMAFELLIVALGVILDIQTSNWNDERLKDARTTRAPTTPLYEIAGTFWSSIFPRGNEAAVLETSHAGFEAAFHDRGHHCSDCGCV